MARDAISGGDRVAAETYYQHAEHYFRVMNSSTDPEPPERRQPRHDGNGRPQANPVAGNGGAAAASDDAAADREGLDRALRLDGSPAAPRQPRAGQGEDQPRDAQSPDQSQGRRRPRQSPPRHGNGRGQAEAEAAQSGHVTDAPEKPGAEAPQPKPVNGDDSGATDDAAPGNEPVGT